MAKIDKLLKQAEEHFDDGECALQTVLGAYETKIMRRDSVRKGIFIATDQRLLFYAKKLTGYDFEAFPYTNISSMEMGKNLMGHYINFFASGNSAKMKWILAGDVRAFAARQARPEAIQKYQMTYMITGDLYPFSPRKQLSPSDRPRAVQGAKRRSGPLTAED